MKRFQGAVNVGLRERDTHRLVAVYPEPLEGEDSDIEDKVKFWYYQKSCSAEDELRNFFVDALSDNEVKQYKSSHGCNMPGPSCGTPDVH